MHRVVSYPCWSHCLCPTVLWDPGTTSPELKHAYGPSYCETAGLKRFRKTTNRRIGRSHSIAVARQVSQLRFYHLRALVGRETDVKHPLRNVLGSRDQAVRPPDNVGSFDESHDEREAKLLGLFADIHGRKTVGESDSDVVRQWRRVATHVPSRPPRLTEEALPGCTALQWSLRTIIKENNENKRGIFRRVGQPSDLDVGVQSPDRIVC